MLSHINAKLSVIQQLQQSLGKLVTKIRNNLFGESVSKIDIPQTMPPAITLSELDPRDLELANPHYLKI
jgi:hypothetical protein